MQYFYDQPRTILICVCVRDPWFGGGLITCLIEYFGLVSSKFEHESISIRVKVSSPFGQVVSNLQWDPRVFFNRYMFTGNLYMACSLVDF